MFGKKIILKITGMSCKHCAKKVENALKSVVGIINAKVYLDRNEAVVTYKGEINIDDLKKKVADLDYQVIEFRKK